MKTDKPSMDKIEQYRKELIELAKHSSLNSPEVIRASTTLDTLLNEYELYRREKNSKR
ncbi:aspartyl-phosphate phosphatase Spo0E family protein [Bacillus sp. DJP31]|uniref:aspartyl-phosphate phosphatase Spo0E family protein n=1 Tax=Bacillus sp. DJP31 TaxID=3409789 RepID=UPI003BB610F0